MVVTATENQHEQRTEQPGHRSVVVLGFVCCLPPRSFIFATTRKKRRHITMSDTESEGSKEERNTLGVRDRDEYTAE